MTRTLRAVPQVWTSKNRRWGWVATYAMSYDNGKSWCAPRTGPTCWRPWSWWAIATARRMADRQNRRRARSDRRWAQEKEISQKLLDSETRIS